MAVKEKDWGWVVIDRGVPTKVIARAMVREAGIIGQIAIAKGIDACTIMVSRKADLARFSTGQLFEIYECIKQQKHHAEVTGMDHALAFPVVMKAVSEILPTIELDPRTLDQLEAEAARKQVVRYVPEVRKAMQNASNGTTGEAKAPRAPKAPVEPGAAPARPPEGTTTGLVWAICDKASAGMPGVMVGDPALRKAIMVACESEGLHPATAATQYSKWARAMRSQI